MKSAVKRRQAQNKDNLTKEYCLKNEDNEFSGRQTQK